MMEKWLRAWSTADQSWAKCGGISMGVVGSGWDLLGREAASSPHVYFYNVQNNRSRVVAINKRGKVVVGTPLSYKQHGSIDNHFQVENRLVDICLGVIVRTASQKHFLRRSSTVGWSFQFAKLLDFDSNHTPT